MAPTDANTVIFCFFRHFGALGPCPRPSPGHDIEFPVSNRFLDEYVSSYFIFRHFWPLHAQAHPTKPQGKAKMGYTSMGSNSNQLFRELAHADRDIANMNNTSAANGGGVVIRFKLWTSRQMKVYSVWERFARHNHGWCLSTVLKFMQHGNDQDSMQ